MKISFASNICPVPLVSQPPVTAVASPSPGGEGRGEGEFNSKFRGRAGFTMMEIAISLAIIGIALVAIIGVLPIGMNAQQDNRQETIVNQDADVIMEDIRNGSLGANDLTNYVFSITNSWAEYNPISGAIMNQGVNTYTFNNASVAANYYTTFGYPLTNGVNIIGLLSTPEFSDVNGNFTADIYNQNFYSNHIVATVYSISGPAIQKPPQDNSLMQQDSFGYRLYCVNAATPVNTNDYYPPNSPSAYENQLAASLHELRLTFLYPLLSSGNVGAGLKTYRTLIAGQLVFQPDIFSSGIFYETNLYVYQAQSFTNTPNGP
jgi:prepilin-type N-terminal cleavage/methylation domain-containing protein